MSIIEAVLHVYLLTIVAHNTQETKTFDQSVTKDLSIQKIAHISGNITMGSWRRSENVAIGITTHDNVINLYKFVFILICDAISIDKKAAT